MKFRQIFDVFSLRGKESDTFVYKVPTTLRNRIILFCQDVFSGKWVGLGGTDHTGEFWSEIHQMLLYRHGRLQLVEEGVARSRAEDAIAFLLTCEDEEFLDFMEYIFRVRALFHVHTDENQLVEEINTLFASEGVGYEMTEMIKEEVVEPVEGYPFFGREQKVIRVVAYPQIIKKDTQIEHVVMIKPALQLLADPRYKSANNEYLEALQDYRKGDYGDCLTKCASAFESVMKIICDTKGWPYKQTDTARTLIRTVIEHGGLPTYFEQPFMIIATLRNRLSKSHGAGVAQRDVSQNIARYALNSTAAAILFLVNETK